MAITQAPLLSLSASGTIAKSVVYGKWRGRRWARGYAVPAKNLTQSQNRTQNVFSFLSSIWTAGSTLSRAPWEAKAKTTKVQARNEFIGRNIRLLRAGSDISSWLGSPGLRASPGLETIVLAPGGTFMTVILGPATVPDGWSLTRKVAVAIPNQDPQSAFVGVMQSAEQLNPASNVNISNLINLTEYAVSGWFEWLRPDGKVAYSQALSGVTTTT